MQTKIYCKTAGKGIQEYFVIVDGKKYFLFRQAYRVSNKEFFGNGVSIDRVNDYSGVHSASVRRTMDKLPLYIRYVEKEYGVSIYDKARKVRKPKCNYGKHVLNMFNSDDLDVAL